MTERDRLLAFGRDELARCAYFAAHERWEEAWHLSVAPEKLAVQALVQLAVALHHLANGNRAGAASVLAKAQRKLSAPDTPLTLGSPPPINMRVVRIAIDRLISELAAGTTPDPATVSVSP